ncbi:hypothetical protein PCYB_006520 [Plasmodium cynomolgi strain B]|uniref:Uncharacterized protein n=1 Tax=Plasmodium cynomolgi (strain B) TaxID=1120755 RepID=K6UNX9_PLACD|nr:hypothetical protein PCYB_006520 [Plasmodium cynomolgi strain B]GAB69903.1 hypothetical protein PCYB_006520 [Plasmodium cynomolgi strain B]
MNVEENKMVPSVEEKTATNGDMTSGKNISDSLGTIKVAISNTLGFVESEPLIGISDGIGIKNYARNI